MSHHANYDTIHPNDPNVPFSYTINRGISAEEIPNLRLPRWHEQMEFKLFLSGQAEIFCGSTLFLARKGDIIVINPCELHGITPVGTEKLRYHLLMLSPSLLYSEHLGSPIPEGILRLRNHIPDNVTARNLFTALFSELSEKKTSYELAAAGYISLLFAELLRNERLPDVHSPRYDDLGRYAEKLEPAFRMIGEQYAGELNLEVLAAACGKSVYHFCRIFSQVTGQTAVEYLNEYRVNKAELLLRSTELSVRDIAAAVGFADNGYFARCFRKIKGITPTECRKKI